MKIETDRCPIGWMAWFPDLVDGATDGHGNGPTGYGDTEALALKDLLPNALEYFETLAYAEGRKDEAADEKEDRYAMEARWELAERMDRKEVELEKAARLMNETGQGEHMGVTK